MNRFTKHVNLILISSSLVLHGCRGWNEEEENKDLPQQGQQQQQTTSGRVGSSTSHHSHFVPFYGGSSRSSTIGSPGVRAGSRGSAGRSSIGGSVRGGFGASAHGVGS